MPLENWKCQGLVSREDILVKSLLFKLDGSNKESKVKELLTTGPINKQIRHPDTGKEN